MKKLWLVLLVFAACSEEARLTTVYTIPAGEHYSFPRQAEVLTNHTLEFEALISSSALECQSTDINKLYGFADCSASHHENSARFGWVANGNMLDIYAYTYCDGRRNYSFIASVYPDRYYKYAIHINDGEYLFYVLDGFCIGKTGTKRCTDCKSGVYYLLYPYYGGDETCNKTIKIGIR